MVNSLYVLLGAQCPTPISAQKSSLMLLNKKRQKYQYMKVNRMRTKVPVYEHKWIPMTVRLADQTKTTIADCLVGVEIEYQGTMIRRML